MLHVRKATTRILCVVAMLAGCLTAAVTSAWAQVPDQWGFAYVNIANGVPTLARQAGSWPAGPTVTVLTPPGGPTYVRFPQIATLGGVVHVTAVSQGPHWCQALNWGPSVGDLLVAVRCHQYGGPQVSIPFTVLFEKSSGLLPAPQAFGYVRHNGAAIVTQFNSSGVANTVVAGPVGNWNVTLPGLGSVGRAGGLQVTAVNPAQPARCKVAAWASAPAGQTVRVRCHNLVNTPINTGWTLTYQRERAITGAALPPKNFAYTFDTAPAAPGPYSPVPPAINHNSQAGLNTVQGAGAGLRLVTFPRVGVLPDHVQVTAYGTGPGYCNLLTPWSTAGLVATVRDVACYNGLVRTNQPSLTTYTSAF
ncbi:hypothetical protein [Streptosporangium carneum]|uniref:CBM2 domain-containing protein n=1 Tax=Streptosporangium carneum TaxID=47481 RepID=A0A9W6MG25_9ACTN|nr:hypothetical protein [Streptosporangium carneum]GLK13284.1 hypothetical protein GCM10017600_66950 [Streptosporangium carneum]